MARRRIAVLAAASMAFTAAITELSGGSPTHTQAISAQGVLPGNANQASATAASGGAEGGSGVPVDLAAQAVVVADQQAQAQALQYVAAVQAAHDADAAAAAAANAAQVAANQRALIIAAKLAQAAAAPPPPPAPAPAPPAVNGGGGAGGPWAALRQCESGGNYAQKANPTYRGAYQFSRQTWDSTMRRLGGSYTAYIGVDPADAPPAVQDAAAMNLQASGGWGQWPACSAKLGL
jgi:resuscitation-promoting factor RpfB